jgi:hypothetical protein
VEAVKNPYSNFLQKILATKRKKTKKQFVFNDPPCIMNIIINLIGIFSVSVAEGVLPGGIEQK